MLAAGFDLTTGDYEILSKILYDETTGDITTEGALNVGTYVGLKDYGASSPSPSVAGSLWLEENAGGTKDQVWFYDGTGTAKTQLIDPNYALAGDVTGTVGATVVEKIRGTNIYSGLSASNRNVLLWDGPFSEWDAGTLSYSDLSDSASLLTTSTTHAGDVSGAYNALSVDKISGVTVDTGTPATDDKLIFNGSQWDQQKTSRVRAYSSSNENVTTTFEKVHYDTETYDTRSEYDASTNYRFTATEAGYYLVSTTILWEVINSGYVVAEIRRNGTTVSYNKMYSTTVENSSQSQVVTDVIYLTASQYVEVWVANYAADGGYIGGATYNTYLCVHKMI